MNRNVEFKLLNFSLINKVNPSKGFAFSFGPKMNILHGRNSSGKTIILESIATMLGSTRLRLKLDNSIKKIGDSVLFILEFKFCERKYISSYEFNPASEERIYKIKDLNSNTSKQGDSSKVIRDFFRENHNYPYYVTWDQSGRQVEINEFVSLFYNYPSKMRDGFMFSGSLPNNSTYTRYIVALFWITFNKEFHKFLKISNDFERLDTQINEASAIQKQLEKLKESANLLGDSKTSDEAVENTISSVVDLERRRRNILFSINELEGITKNKIKNFSESIEGKDFFNHLSTIIDDSTLLKIKTEMEAYAVSKHENMLLAKNEIATLRVSLSNVEKELSKLKDLADTNQEKYFIEKAYEVLKSRIQVDTPKAENTKEIDDLKNKWKTFYEKMKNAFSKTNPEVHEIIGADIEWQNNSIELDDSIGGAADQLVLRIAAQINMLLTLSKADYEFINFRENELIKDGRVNVNLAHIIDGPFAEDLSKDEMQITDEAVDKIVKLLCSYNNQIIFSVANEEYYQLLKNEIFKKKIFGVKEIKTHGKNIFLSTVTMDDNSQVVANYLLEKLR